MIHFPFVSRPIASRPWDRFPSDTWLYGDAKFSALSGLMITHGFSFLFTLAWNFHFPTYTEKLLLVESTCRRCCAAPAVLCRTCQGHYNSVYVLSRFPPLYSIDTLNPHFFSFYGGHLVSATLVSLSTEGHTILLSHFVAVDSRKGPS